MKFKSLIEKYNSIKNIKVVGKSFINNGNLCELIGFYIHKRKLMMLIIEHNNELYNECDFYEDDIKTHRLEEYKSIFVQNNDSLNDISNVVIDDKNYRVCENSSTKCILSDYENTVILSLFIANGWKVENFKNIETDECFLMCVHFEGIFNKVPSVNDTTSIKFKFRDIFQQCLVEQSFFWKWENVPTKKLLFRKSLLI